MLNIGIAKSFGLDKNVPHLLESSDMDYVDITIRLSDRDYQQVLDIADEECCSARALIRRAVLIYVGQSRRRVFTQPRIVNVPVNNNLL